MSRSDVPHDGSRQRSGAEIWLAAALATVSLIFVLASLPLALLGQDVFRFMLTVNTALTLLAVLTWVIGWGAGCLEIFLPPLATTLSVSAWLGDREVVQDWRLLAQLAAFTLWALCLWLIGRRRAERHPAGQAGHAPGD